MMEVLRSEAGRMWQSQFGGQVPLGSWVVWNMFFYPPTPAHSYWAKVKLESGASIVPTSDCMVLWPWGHNASDYDFRVVWYKTGIRPYQSSGSYQLPTTEVWVQSQDSPCGFVLERVTIKQVLLWVLQLSFHFCNVRFAHLSSGVGTRGCLLPKSEMAWSHPITRIRIKKKKVGVMCDWYEPKLNWCI
jgi:hypothetical protein